MKKKIYIFDGLKLTDDDFFEKGFRGDIILELDNKLYLFEFISIERLNNEYLYSKKTNSPCLIDTPTIILEEIKIEGIIDSLLKLDDNEVSALSPINMKDKFEYYPKEYQDLNNWRCIH